MVKRALVMITSLSKPMSTLDVIHLAVSPGAVAFNTDSILEAPGKL